MKVITQIAVKFRLFWTIAALLAVFVPLPSQAGNPPLRKGMTESEVLKAWGKPTQVLNESGHISWIYSNVDKEVFIPMYALFHKERTVTITFSHGKVSNYTVLQ